MHFTLRTGVGALQVFKDHNFLPLLPFLFLSFACFAPLQGPTVPSPYIRHYSMTMMIFAHAAYHHDHIPFLLIPVISRVPLISNCLVGYLIAVMILHHFVHDDDLKTLHF